MNLFISKEGKKVSPLAAALNIVVVCAAVVLVFWASLAVIGIKFDFGFLSYYRNWVFRGLKNTVFVSFFSLIFSLLVGILSAAGASSRVLVLRYLCRGYVTVIRGTPLIMQIYLFYYIVGTAWGIESRFASGVIILSVFEGAYISEIIRGSYLSIDETQLEAARAVGFNRRQTLRHVILPQMVARTIPALAGQFASIIKDSSLLSIIAVVELSQTFHEISTSTFHLFESYLVLGGLYLCLTLPITFISKRLERRFYYEN